MGIASTDTDLDDGCATLSCEGNDTQKRRIPRLTIETQNDSDHEEVIDEDREHEDLVSTPGNSPRDTYDLNAYEEVEPVWWFGRGDEDYAAPGQGTVTAPGVTLPNSHDPEQTANHGSVLSA